MKVEKSITAQEVDAEDIGIGREPLPVADQDQVTTPNPSLTLTDDTKIVDDADAASQAVDVEIRALAANEIARVKSMIGQDKAVDVEAAVTQEASNSLQDKKNPKPGEVRSAVRAATVRCILLH